MIVIGQKEADNNYTSTVFKSEKKKRLKQLQIIIMYNIF